MSILEEKVFLDDIIYSMARIPVPEAVQNTPLKKPTKNVELWKIVGRLFVGLQIENPNQINNLQDFFEKVEYKGVGKGLLSHLEESQTDKGETLDFVHIQDEAIPLSDLSILEDISDTLKSARLPQPLGNQINTAIGDIIKDKVRVLIIDPTKQADFTTALTGIDNLHTIAKKTQDFLANDDALKKKNIWEKLTITNQEIKTTLVAGWTIVGPDLDGPSTAWNGDAKKCMDALVSLELSKSLQANLGSIEELVEGINTTLSNAFPMMSCILKKYPFVTKNSIPSDSPLYPQLQDTLRQYRSITINPIYDSAKKTEKLAEVQKDFDTLYREAYVLQIRTDDPLLADSLKEVWDKNFNFSTVDPAKMQYFFNWIADNPYDDLEEIMKVFNITKSIDKIEFHKFYHDLVDISKTTIDLPRGISLQVKKTVKDLNISPLDLYDKNTSLHTLPISYELNTDDFDQFEIADRVAIQKFLETSFGVDNKTVTVDGDKIGRLIYLFFLDKNTDTTAITALSPQNEKSLKEIFDQAIDIEHPILEGIETVNLTPKEKFIEERNKVKGYPFTDEDCGFRPGTRLVAAIWDTRVPPKENGGHEWIQMEIESIDTSSDPSNPTFTVEVHGVEQPQGDGWEWSSQKISMTKERLEAFNKYGGFYKLPDIKSDNPLKHLEEFKKANKNGMGFKWVDTFDGLEWDSDHFTKDFTGEGKKEPVEYFGYQDTMYDKKGGTHKENIMYAVKYNPQRKTFTVRGEFNDYIKGDKAKHYQLDPKHEMDYNSFMMFISEKNLKPWKKDEAEQLVEDQNQQNMTLFNKKEFKINRFTPLTIWKGIKAKRKELNDKLGEREKNSQKQFENLLVDDLWLRKLIDNTLGWIPAIWEAVGTLQLDRYNERDKEVFAKIETVLKVFEADPDFATTFPETPPHVRRMFGGKSYKEFLVGGDDFKWPKGQITPLKGDALYTGAALLLANITKGKGMYRGISEYENSWLWVAKLLGKDHRNNFMRRKQELMAEINSNKRDTDRLREQLSRCEIDYILNNIRGSNPYPNTRFGSIEKRGEYPTATPEYIDNPSKRRLSNAFADKLDEAYKNRNTQSNIDSIVQTLPNDFGIAKAEFEGKLKSGRFPIAMANLKKMHTLMRTDEEKRIVEWCVIAVLLSGEMNTYPDKKVIRWFSTLAKTAGIIPGFAIKYADHPKRVLYLLNKATNGQFWEKLKVGGKTYSPSDFWPGANKVAVGDLVKAVNVCWNRETAGAVHNFFDGDLRNKTWDVSPDNDPILKDFHDALFSTDIDITDNDMLDNDDGINLQGINASKNVARNRMEYRNGEFDGKDADEKSARESFWKRVSDQLNSGGVSPEVAMRKFLGWFESKGFSDSEKERIVQSIKTAAHYKGHASIGSRSLKDSTGASYNMGKLSPNDRKDILRYTFKGKVIQHGTGHPPTVFDNTLDGFLKMFENNITEIASDDFIGRVFGSQYKGIKPLKFVWWDQYNAVFGKDDQNYLVDALEGMQEYSLSDKKKKANEERKKHRSFFTRVSQWIINTDMRNTEKSIEKYYTSRPLLSPKEDLDSYEERDVA